jgi:hypothetical protein
MGILQCLSCRLWRLYSTLYECCLIVQKSGSSSFVHKPLTELEAKVIVLWLQTLYSSTHKGTTAPHAVYAKLHSKKSPSHVTWWVISMYSTQLLFILHTAPTMAVYWWQEWICFPHTLHCTAANISAGFCLIWILKLVLFLCIFSIPIAKTIQEMPQ